MKLHDLAASGLLMQIVDVLRDQEIDAAARLELGQRVMRRIRARGDETRPAAIAARPVEAPHFLAANKIVVVDRLVPCPRSARTAIVGNA